jgi:hypothetical protein
MEVVGKKLRDMMLQLKGGVISRSRSVLDNKRHIESFFEVEQTQNGNRTRTEEAVLIM